MTENKTSLYKKGNRCRTCIGCGACMKKKPDAVSGFFVSEREKHGQEEAVSVKTGVGEEERQQTKGYLIAADIGTTTVVLQLRRILNGAVEDTFACENPQRIYGADVLSRLEAAEDAAIREKMQQAVEKVLGEGIGQFKKHLLETGDTEEIRGMAVAANTTMTHLLLGYDVSGLGSYPFTPYNLNEVRTKLCGLDCVVLPGISAFLGGDITAGIKVLSMDKRRELSLLIDLGTNGEMVLGNKNGLLATSVAAGPAFEGGAYFGTDLMSCAARLLAEGKLDETGLLADPYFETGIMVDGVQVTQKDIRSLQLAKAAVSAGIQILSKKYGLREVSRIDRVFLAGGMGYYLDKKAAVDIGLIPGCLEKKTFTAGNTSLEGAFLYGRESFLPESPSKRALNGEDRQAAGTAGLITEFNLAEEAAFAKEYVNAMNLKPRP